MPVTIVVGVGLGVAWRLDGSRLELAWGVADPDSVGDGGAEPWVAEGAAEAFAAGGPTAIAAESPARPSSGLAAFAAEEGRKVMTRARVASEIANTKPAAT